MGQSGSLARGDRISAVALGLALSTNQLAWFLAPFLLVGIYLARSLNLGSRRAAAVTARYLGLAVATFVVINLPFILWGPVAWWQGIMAPLTQHALPYGQGIVGLTLFLHLGGGATDAYSYAAEFSYVALLAVYIFEYRRLSRCCFVLPTIALYASGRSLSGYWMVLLAVIVVGVVTADEGLLTHVGPRGPARTRRGRAQLTRRLLIGVLALPAVALLVIALTTPQPLTMHILGAHSDPQLRSVKQVIVEVRNSSGSALSPHFATDTRGQASPFWRVTRGPASLAPGAQATYTLLATDLGSVPANGTPFLLQAVTGEPRTISSSELFTQSGPAPGNW